MGNFMPHQTRIFGQFHLKQHHHLIHTMKLKINNTISFGNLNGSLMRDNAQMIQIELITRGFLAPNFFMSEKTPSRPNFSKLPTGEIAGVSFERPIVDGQIGIDTATAINRFAAAISPHTGIEHKPGMMTPELFDALLRDDTRALFPIIAADQPGDDAQMLFIRKIIRFMIDQEYYIALGPDVLNIVYVEGVDGDGRENTDEFNLWNDRRVVFRIDDDGNPVVMVNVAATTEPGRFYTQNPMNRMGAARIAFGQYKSHCIGLHNGEHPALVQRSQIRVHRDMNKDGKRSPNDPIVIGSAFGLNQHTTRPGEPPALVGKYSAGCLVGQSYSEHMSFMGLIRNDIRAKNNAGFLFPTAVISGTELNKV
jgi:hypothetical protein